MAIIFFIIITLLLFIYCYFKYRYGFWIEQPVFHIYNLGYYIAPCGIIDSKLPSKNKFVNLNNIKTSLISQLDDFNSQQIINFINNNYLTNGGNRFIINRNNANNFNAYFTGLNGKCFISQLTKDDNLVSNKNGIINIIPHQKLIGLMTSRPINIIINQLKRQKNLNASFGDATPGTNGYPNFLAYYVDYLCVDLNERKKGYAPQLIQTHHYNQRREAPHIYVSLFKREDELTGIVPLCVYKTYGFNVTNWNKPQSLPKPFKLVEINTQNLTYLMDFINKLLEGRENSIFIYSSLANLNELIKTKNIFVTMVVNGEKICGAYFFKKSCVEIETDLEVLTCYCSFYDEMTSSTLTTSISGFSKDLFILGFKNSFWNCAYENYFGFCAIEELSYNNIIINNIIQKTKPLIISPTAYYFYNFAYNTFPSENVFIL